MLQIKIKHYTREISTKIQKKIKVQHITTNLKKDFNLYINILVFFKLCINISLKKYTFEPNYFTGRIQCINLNENHFSS